MKDVKQNKPGSVDTTVARLEGFFGDRELPLRSLDRAGCAARYEELCEGNAVDTHRNVLAEAKTFGKWCVEKGLLSRNPLAEIQGIGKRKKGKPQLRIDEARKWTGKAFELALAADVGAVAALLALLMGMRSGEIVSREVRDVDDEGRVLWIPDSKTPAGRRRLQVPEALRPLLLGLCGDRPAGDRLFGDHQRDWVLDQVRRICRAAKVPEVTAHGMRGLHSTLAEESGVSAHAVSKALGHESVATTHAHYTTATAQANAKQKRALQVLQGGAR